MRSLALSTVLLLLCAASMSCTFTGGPVARLVNVAPVRSVPVAVKQQTMGRFYAPQQHHHALAAPPPVDSMRPPADINMYFNMDALTETIKELDEVVQEIKPVKSVCEPASEPPQTVKISLEVKEVGRDAPATPAPTTTTSTTTESFYDPTTAMSKPEVAAPVEQPRQRRDSRVDNGPVFTANVPASVAAHFGMPNELQAAHQDDFAKATQDLRTLKKDLGQAADWLKHNNNNVHSTMLRVLQAYVSSIERQMEQKRMLSVQNRNAFSGIKDKLALVKSKVASLLDKLKSLIPFRANSRSSAVAMPSGPGGIVTTAPSTFNNNGATTVTTAVGLLMPNVAPVES